MQSPAAQLKAECVLARRPRAIPVEPEQSRLGGGPRRRALGVYMTRNEQINNPAAIGSCSQIVERVQLDWRSELVAIHKEPYDGVVHEHGFGETNSFPC